MADDLDDIPDFVSTPSYSPPRKVNSDDSDWEPSDDEEIQKKNFQDKGKFCNITDCFEHFRIFKI